MPTRRIGSLDVSVVGLGTNNFGFSMREQDVAPVVDAALEAGITLFDTADVYGESEARLGRALGRRRDDVVIATKFGMPLGEDWPGGAGPAYVRRAVDRSLRALGVDRIDLYQLHRPDPATPLAETLGALDDLVRAGKVVEVGCSNFGAGLLEEAAAAARPDGARFAGVQNHYNLLHRSDEADVLPACERLGVAYVPYFPLASGLLTGKYHRDEPPPPGSRLAAWGSRASALLADDNLATVGRLSAWAAERGRTVGHLAIAWLLSRPVVASVIAGATTPEQVRSNAAAADFTLTSEDVAEVEALVPAPA